MTNSDTSSRRRGISLLAGMLLLCGATGCQIDVGGQVLPSPYYLDDDVQYYAPGTEFKLQQEATRLKETSQDEVGDEF
ncbi:MAG: hypothetical protein KDA42_03685 [Planctomycetales bacterium]|nr:hypothetical protein [Planctomycetales bacterium]